MSCIYREITYASFQLCRGAVVLAFPLFHVPTRAAIPSRMARLHTILEASGYKTSRQFNRRLVNVEVFSTSFLQAGVKNWPLVTL